MVSGTVSLFCSKCFSPFPHGTGSLSVSREYLALPDGPGRFTQDSSCPALLRMTHCADMPSHTGLSPSAAELSRSFCSTVLSQPNVLLQPPHCRNNAGLGSSPFARHYWGNHSYFLFLRVLRCFSSPRSPPAISRMSPLQGDGLSHSEIRGSKVICTYPRLIAAYHVLHRLREPRHPPCALTCFFLFFKACPVIRSQRACRSL